MGYTLIIIVFILFTEQLFDFDGRKLVKFIL